MGIILFTVAIMPMKGSSFPQTQCLNISTLTLSDPTHLPGQGPWLQGAGQVVCAPDVIWTWSEEKLSKPLRRNTVWLGHSLEGVGVKGREPRECCQPLDQSFK